MIGDEHVFVHWIEHGKVWVGSNENVGYDGVRAAIYHRYEIRASVRDIDVFVRRVIECGVRSRPYRDSGENSIVRAGYHGHRV